MNWDIRRTLLDGWTTPTFFRESLFGSIKERLEHTHERIGHFRVETWDFLHLLINVMEMPVAWFALQAFQSSRQGHLVVVMNSNTIMLASINRQGEMVF